MLEQCNRGPAAARNAGLNAARGEIVLFVYDDILCDKRLLSEHRAAHCGDGPCLGWGPVLMAPESAATLATDRAQADVDAGLAAFAVEGRRRWPPKPAIDVDANSSLPRATLLACGGFDEAFFLTRENAKLGMRLWKLGVRHRYLPSAVTHQIQAKSVNELVRREAYWYGRNEILLCRKHPEYRPYSALAGIGSGTTWRRALREALRRFPLPVDWLLRPLWGAITMPVRAWTAVPIARLNLRRSNGRSAGSSATATRAFVRRTG